MKRKKKLKTKHMVIKYDDGLSKLNSKLEDHQKFKDFIMNAFDKTFTDRRGTRA